MDEGLTRSIRRKKYLKMRIAGGGESTYLCPYMLGLLSTNPSPSLTCNGTTQQKDDDTTRLLPLPLPRSARPHTPIRLMPGSPESLHS